MTFNNRWLLTVSFISMFVLAGCSGTGTVKSTSQSEGKESTPSPADLAQLRDDYNLNPDAAIVSGMVVSLADDTRKEALFEVNKLEKKGFGFSANLKAGDKISINTGKEAENIKAGQKLLVVISAIKIPGGADNQFLLEKLLAVVPD
jgi:hypothetical protein